jgi:hypothetical protein
LILSIGNNLLVELENRAQVLAYAARVDWKGNKPDI